MVRRILLETGATPTPVREIGRFGLAGSLLLTLSKAENGPATEGAKRTVTSVDLPAETVSGGAGETTVKAAPLIEIDRTVRSDEPLLLIVNFESLVWPVVTPPKSSKPGETKMD